MMAPISGQQLLQQTLTTPEARAAWQRWVAALPPTVGAGTLGPVQEAQFQDSLNNLGLDYQTQRAQNTFRIGQMQDDFHVQRNNLLRQFVDMRRQAPYGFNARGLLGSGIWRNQLGRMNDEKTRMLAEQRRQYVGNLGSIPLANQGLVNNWTGQQGNLWSARASGLNQQALNRLGQGIG